MADSGFDLDVNSAPQRPPEDSGQAAPAASPIADLSYRDYDGPLAPPQYRWWVVAKMTIRMAFKKKSLWWISVLASFYYLIMLIVLFVVDQTSANSSNPEASFQAFMSRVNWKDQFFHGWAWGQMWFFFIALLVGAGAIANDNRANALLVYLSKPCDKRDYLVGKWCGLFLTLILTMAIPSVFFYLYAGLSYTEYGFFSQDPLLFFRLVLTLGIGAAFYSSLTLGVSSMFNQGRIAGATLAAIYFLSYFFTKLMEFAYMAIRMDEGARRDIGAAKHLIERMYYASVDGLQIGMSKAVLGTDGSVPFGLPPPRRGGPAFVPAPELWAVLGIMILISALALWIAWRRIRAVEVVR